MVNPHLPRLSKYDYGYIRNGAMQWPSGGGVPAGGVGFFGPPGSLWWTSFLPWLLPFIRFSFILLIILWPR